MGNKILTFTGSTTPKAERFIHVSELIAYRFKLNFDVMNIEPVTVQSPNGARTITLPPKFDQVSNAIAESFDANALKEMSRLTKSAAPNPDGISKAIPTEEGISQIFSGNERETALALQGAKIVAVANAIFNTISESLDEQFPFLSKVNSDFLEQALFTIPDIAPTEQDMLRAQLRAQKTYEMVVAAAAKDAGGEWIVIKTDHNLANKIQRAVEKAAKFMGFSL